MKVYVDELPKSYNDCKFRVYIAHYQNGWEHSERYCSIVKDSYDCKCSKERCPLQSLADHDKQVRKQVCDEIRELALNYFVLPICYNCGETSNDDVILTGNDLTDILDQIDKGE